MKGIPLLEKVILTFFLMSGAMFSVMLILDWWNHRPRHTPKPTPIKSKTYYEPRWEPSEPHGVWMGDKFFHALNPFVPGNPNWADAKLGGYDIYFEVDTNPYDVHWRVSSIEVMLQGRFIDVEAELVYGPTSVYGPNSEPHLKVDYSVGLDEGRGWEVATKLIEELIAK